MNQNSFSPPDNAGQSMSDPTIVSQPQQSKCKGSKIWKMLAFFFALFSIAAIFGLVFFYLNSQELEAKLDDTQDNLNAKISELTKLQELLSEANADIEDKSAQSSSVDTPVVDFKAIRQVAGIDERKNDWRLLISDDAFIKNSVDNKYQIMRFDVAEGMTGYMLYLYRELPKGDWQKSNFSGQGRGGIIACDHYTKAELAAFSAIQYDSEAEYIKNDHWPNHFICLK